MTATDWLWNNWLRRAQASSGTYTRFRHVEFLEEPGKRREIETQLARLVHEYHTFADFDSDLLGQIGYAHLARVLTGDQRPHLATTRKGNFLEILACDLAKRISGYDIPVLRLQYNPNPDQSMKGDDVLGFIFANDTTEPDRVLIVEAKFRSSFSTDAVREGYAALTRGFRPYPASLEFIATILTLRGERQKAESIRQVGRRLAFGSTDGAVQRRYVLFVGTVGHPQNPFSYLENLDGSLLSNLTALNVVFGEGFVDWLNQLYEMPI